MRLNCEQTKKRRKNAEAKFRAEAEKGASEKFALEREQHSIEKKRLEQHIADMQRQLGQKSAELQGEALEVYLKRQLQLEFPADMINDVGRGQHGADLTQQVIDRQLGACGVLVWEAKRTKRWQDSWIAKIKKDADRVGTHLRIIVSETLPADIGTFGLRDGVWICNIECALPLAWALRSPLIESARVSRAGQGRDLKMDVIYEYLTSPQFSERIQRMVETWEELKNQVDKEERAMQRQWKARRKQLANIMNLTIDLYTDFTHILGHEIPQVPGLELEALPPGDNIQVIDQ